MDRKTFIQAGCLACISTGFLSMILQSCDAVKYTSGTMNKDGLLVDIKEFETRNGHLSYIIVKHESLQYPVCVYRIDETHYNALLMKCTHQGTELQAAGERLICTAHGSEFDKFGKVMQSPAAEDLRTFPVSIVNNQIFIDLRKR